ncbi:MAG: hypothetical protein Fur002_05440 [Anaerolineales bacterium]
MNLQNFAIRLLAKSGAAELARRALTRRARFVLNLHGVSSRRYENVPMDLQPHHSVEEFRQTLAWISKRFHFLTTEEFFHSAASGVLLTFDDGHANNLTNALPVLKEFNAQGLFFISAQHVKNPRDWLSFTRNDARRGWGEEASVPEDFARDCYDGLSESQLAELAASPNAVIGGHTVTHPFLAESAPEVIRREVEDSKRYLESIIQKRVDYFAYPYGSYTLQAAQIVKDAGYAAAFAVNGLRVGLPRFEIPRVGIYASAPDYLNLKLSGLHRRPLRGKIL